MSAIVVPDHTTNQSPKNEEKEGTGKSSEGWPKDSMCCGGKIAEFLQYHSIITKVTGEGGCLAQTPVE
ncbi:unnamed protein product [Rodentolepis nana]|uniref:Uncharacterized protein n=1 Tax=Rodentolepis nana TaxID=102285 RepID=A0A0R3T4C0_RODNA|nr:unnamed protein product [Rodentolepis nana]